MRKRAKRDLITLLGVVVILAGIVGVNIYMRLDSLKEAYTKMRIAFEEKHRAQGVQLIDWSLLHKTRGMFRSGATFTEDLKEKDGRLVNICGFMAPIDQFRNVSHFMLLPVPITCYFCEAPPMRDVIEVRLNAPANMVNEPVLIGGRLRLHEGPRQPFFYTIEDARWNEAVKDEILTDKEIGADHIIHLQQGFEQLYQDSEKELMPGQEPPAPVTLPPTPAPAPVPGPTHTPPLDMGELLPPQEPPAP